jgi:archaellum component FlaC
MHYLYRFLGILLLLVGLAGLVASCTGIGFAWNVRDAWRAEAANQLGAIEEGLGLVSDVADKAKKVVKMAQKKVKDLDHMVKLVAEELQKKGPIEKFVVPGLEHDLKEWCEEAKDWVRSLEQAAETARSTLMLFSSLPLTTQDESARERSAGLRVAAQQLDEITLILKNLAKWLGELRNRVDLENNLQRLGGLVNDVDGRLKSIQGELHRFDGRIQSWKDTAGKLKEDVPHLFALGTWALTGFLAWFAIGQLALLILGWQLTRTAPAL